MPIREQSQQRLLHLYEISRLLTTFESIEETFDRALGIVAETLPLSSATLIEERNGHLRMISWPSEDVDVEMMEAAKAHAETAFRYLVGARSSEPLDLHEESGRTALPQPVDPQPESIDRKRFIVIPLVVDRNPPFGALQLEGAHELREPDLVFVNALANQLALALDRHYAWQRDITRREEAEKKQSRAEAKEIAADRRRLSAEALMERYEALVDNLDRAFVWEADAKTLRIVYVSGRAEALLGYPREQWLEQPNGWRPRVHPEDWAAFLAMLERTRAGQRDQRCDHRCIA